MLKLYRKSINFQFLSLNDELSVTLHTFTGNKSGTMTIDTALDLLQAAAAEMEEESEV